MGAFGRGMSDRTGPSQNDVWRVPRWISERKLHRMNNVTVYGGQARIVHLIFLVGLREGLAERKFRVLLVYYGTSQLMFDSPACCDQSFHMLRGANQRPRGGGGGGSMNQ